MNIARTPSIAIATLERASRFSLRLAPAEAREIGRIGTIPLDLPINCCATSGALTSARLGPNEWLLLGPLALGAEIAGTLEGALKDRVASVVDVSHRNCAFQVSGVYAREVINGGCPLDLDDAAFPPGHATRTLLGKAEIVLMRPDTAHTYRIECWRSFAPYVRGLLDEVAREFEANAYPI